jgi:hypothetical protein
MASFSDLCFSEQDLPNSNKQDVFIFIHNPIALIYQKLFKCIQQQGYIIILTLYICKMIMVLKINEKFGFVHGFHRVFN